uniref:DH domain-containing protein n=1 Tax=Bactrocera latifrons TaxID=174628 RepID=A0A0K8UPB6_BACLA
MPTAHQSARDDITTPGESPGGRLSRWFSIRRGSSHQYDVGGRQTAASSIDMPDAAALSACGDSVHPSPQKLSANKMPDVPENDDEEAAITSSRFDLDLMLAPGSRANGSAHNAHTRLITPMLPPAPPGLSQQQLKRRHIVAAIVHSENSYVATLQRLVNVCKSLFEISF